MPKSSTNQRQRDVQLSALPDFHASSSTPEEIMVIKILVMQVA